MVRLTSVVICSYCRNTAQDNDVMMLKLVVGLTDITEMCKIFSEDVMHTVNQHS